MRRAENNFGGGAPWSVRASMSSDGPIAFGVRQLEQRIGCWRMALTTYPPHACMPPHEHDLPKLSMVVAGSVEEQFGRGDERASAGSVVAKPAGARHSNVVGPHGMTTLAVWCEPSGPNASRGGAGQIASGAWNSALSAYRWVHGGPLARVLFRIRQMLGGGPPSGLRPALRSSNRAEPGEALLCRALEHLEPQPRRAGAGRGPRWMGAVRDDLHARCLEPVRVMQLADDWGVHPVYLARAFHCRFGCTILSYVNRLRVRRAAELLAGDDVPLSTVAQRAGFCDQPHFCRRFKKHLGVTPAEYRALARGR